MFANFTEAMLELFVTSLWETIVMVGISGVVGACWAFPGRVSAVDRPWRRAGKRPRQQTGGLGGERGAFHAVHHLAGGHHSAHALCDGLVNRHGRRRGTAHHCCGALCVARLVESALREVDHGLVEAAQAMGATTSQIVWKVLLPEALPGIVAGLTITFVSLTGYSAMAGAIGGGGLGDLGIRYGYQRFLPEIMLAVVLVLIFLQGRAKPGRLGGAQAQPPVKPAGFAAHGCDLLLFDSCQRLLHKRWQLFLFEIDWRPLTIGPNLRQKQGQGPRALRWICIRAAVVNWAKWLRGCTNALPARPGA